MTETDLYRNNTVVMWISALSLLRTVVCVTAAENYRLEKCEQEGITGPRKYAEAGVVFTCDTPPWVMR